MKLNDAGACGTPGRLENAKKWSNDLFSSIKANTCSISAIVDCPATKPAVGEVSACNERPATNAKDRRPATCSVIDDPRVYHLSWWAAYQLDPVFVGLAVAVTVTLVPRAIHFRMTPEGVLSVSFVEEDATWVLERIGLAGFRDNHPDNVVMIRVHV
jgi:hypothetical protein